MKAVDFKLYWKLRGEARAAARSNARIWKEYKRRRKARPPGQSALQRWLGPGVWPLLLALTVPLVSGRVGVNGLLALLSLYCSGTIFLRANSLGRALYSSWERYLAMHFPISDTSFFSWRVRLWVAWHASLFVLCAVVYGFAAANSNGAPGAWIATAAGAFVQTEVVMAFALNYSRWSSRVRFGIGLIFYAVMAAVVWFPGQTLEVTNRLILILPAAWINWLFIATEGGSKPSLAILLGLAPTVAVADVYLVRALWKSYPRGELQIFERVTAERVLEEDPEFAQNPTATESAGRDFAVSREHFAALRNRSRVEAVLAEAGPSRVADHWTSRLGVRWLTEREKSVANFLLGGVSDGWGKRWKLALQLAAAGLVISAIPLVIPIVVPLTLFGVAAAGSAPLLGGRWAGLTVGHFGFGRFQPCAGYPVGYAEASKVMMKLNAARVLGFVPIALASGLTIGWKYFSAPLYGALVTAQIVILVLALQPYFCAFQHSAGTNDTKKLSWTAVWLLCAFVMNMLIFVPAAVSFFALGKWILTWVIAIPVLFFMPFSMWWVYGLSYNRGRIDLQNAGV